MATTTAAITGINLNEIFKVVQNKTNISSYRGIILNLGDCQYIATTPNSPPSVEVRLKLAEGHKLQECEFSKMTEWQYIELKAPMKIHELINHIEKTHNVEVTLLKHGKAELYNSIFDNESEDILNMDVAKRYAKLLGPISEHEKWLGMEIDIALQEIGPNGAIIGTQEVRHNLKYWLKP